MKVFLYGRRGAGKSTIIKKLLDELELMPSGFRTVKGPANAEGGYDFYIIDAAGTGSIDLPGRIGRTFPDGSWESYSEAFDDYGVRLLAFREKPEIIVMDELGFMEAQAGKFQSRVLEILEEDIPVIGVVKQMPEPFLQKIFRHPAVRTIEVTEENRDGVYAELKEIFRRIGPAGNDIRKSKRKMPDTAGLILAAGLSLRMGETKALLKFGKETLIERQIRCFLNAGVKDVFIVLGRDAQSVEAAANAYPVKTIYNPDYKNGMFTSVKAGLRAVKQGGFAAVFLLPVDCPLVTPRMLGILMERFMEGGVKIVYPCHKNEKGHPPLFSAGLIGGIFAYSGEGGLKEALARHEHEAAAVEAGSGCLIDIDTREEYIRALKLSGIAEAKKA